MEDRKTIDMDYKPFMDAMKDLLEYIDSDPAITDESVDIVIEKTRILLEESYKVKLHPVQ